MVGRRPKPTALKELEGSRIRRKATELKPGGVPKCPAHLDKVAKREWKRISTELIALGLLTEVDRAALAAYCVAWSRWVEAEEHVQEHGLVVKAPSGYPMQNPYIGVANTALDHMRKFLIEFGLTPASRSRINAQPVARTPEDDEWSFADIRRSRDKIRAASGQRKDPGMQVGPACVSATPN